jgi:metal-responsive CopG/Arc/MetJ family transcriptional regulator
MNVAIQAELPEQLVDELHRFIREGRAEGLNQLLQEALRRYLDSHSVALAESFLKQDVDWGLHGRS